jgi:hypothetical protein
MMNSPPDRSRFCVFALGKAKDGQVNVIAMK